MQPHVAGEQPSLADRAECWCFADIWIGSLNHPPGSPECEALLSAEERVRAARYRFEHSRAAFVRGRAYLRRILASHLRTRPQDVPLRTSPAGKPFVPGSEVHFNVSHSGGLFACIVSWKREVGIDIEQMRTISRMAEIAGRYFARAEVDTWRRLPEPARRAAFFRCWTRKEAFLKGCGEGLGRPLDSFTVSLDASSGNCLLAPLSESSKWHLLDFEPADGYAGALAVSGGSVPVRYRVRRFNDISEIKRQPKLAE